MGKNDVVVVSAVRTPFGKFGGTLKDIPSIDLGAMVIREVLKRVKVKGEEVEETYYGSAIPAEVALETDVPARQATLRAGMPSEAVSITVDRACCSSLAAVRLGYRTIRSGEIEVALGVGAENMSRTPLILPPYVRWGRDWVILNCGMACLDWAIKGSTLFQSMPERSLLNTASPEKIRTDGLVKAR